jgi:hypothetical protein
MLTLAAMSAPNQTITLEFSQEFYDRIVNKLAGSWGSSVEDAVRLVTAQALEAPEDAIRWMRARYLADNRVHEGHAQPSAANAWVAYGEAVRAQVLRETERERNLAAAVRALF